MELKEKVKKEFEKWYINNYCRSLTNLNLIKLEIKLFYSMHSSMQFGVFQDYFDSFYIRVDISEISEPTMAGAKLKGYMFYINGFKSNKTTFKTRPEARVSAIAKANEIRNKQLN